MTAVCRIGAYVALDPAETDADMLGICVGLFAELEDGRRVAVDPAHCRVSGPRRGPGALWGRLSGDPRTLATLDHDLFDRDPLAAVMPALGAEFALRGEHVADIVRNEMVDHPDLQSNLELALDAAGVAAVDWTAHRDSVQVDLEPALRAELER